jgi:hypothetical protein
MDDAEINELVKRLSRPHRSGGVVIERAAIMAAGIDSMAVIDWILDHSGMPEAAASPPRNRGLHGGRLSDTDVPASRRAQSFVLPAGAVSSAASN